MTKLVKGLCATIAACSVAAGTIGTASAASTRIPGISVSDSAVEQVHYTGNKRFKRRNGHVYWNGHRGYRDRRRGYRYYNGYWFPAAAFLGGVIIGNAINQPRPVYRHGDWYRLHVEWCDDRYRSYRVSDDTFQPYHGPRRRCNSPYDRY